MDRLMIIIMLTLGVGGIAFGQSLSRNEDLLSSTKPIIGAYNAEEGSRVLLRWGNSLELAGENRYEKIQCFLSDYSADMGLKSSLSFELVSEQEDVAGFHHLKMAQFYQGIAVFDGHLSFHFDQQDKLKNISGVLLIKEDLDTTAELTPSDAANVALNWLEKTYPGAQADVVKNDLYVYQEGLVKGRDGNVKLAYYLELSNQQDIRDYLLVDAKTGQLIEHIPALCHLINREVYLGSLNNMIWREGDIFPAMLDTLQQSQVQYSESVYYLFKNSFQYTSYDNQNGVMRIVDQASFIDCPNATWNGYSTNYCNNIGSDDVVGHEWGHAYNEYTSNLLLIWQAGAINEAYSDIWGETLDMLNGDTDVNILRTDCDNSSRWKIAEAAGALTEPIRDMYNPVCYDHPGKLSDEQYYCGPDGALGVHRNSAIVTHTYALLVDGGEYNGYSIQGIGLTKAAHIFWQAQRMYLSRTSDFKALANALEVACNDLRGINLPDLSLTMEGTGLSGQKIDANDSLSLSLAIAATEMRLDLDICPEYDLVLSPDAEDWCNEFGKSFYPFYAEDFEGDIAGWNMLELAEDTTHWVDRQWQLTGSMPDHREGKGMFGPNPNVGDCTGQENSGIIRLESPAIIIPDNIEGHVYLTFDHYFSLEKGQDGGNVKIQQDGGGWTKIPPSAFIFNTYNDILPVASYTNNPMAGERVFSGANEGAVSGSWGTTQIDLDIIGVRSGDEIVMRWELGTNGCDGWHGWYVDDIKLGTCSLERLLPVEWLSFDLQDTPEGIALDWTTVREENNAGFYVERSLDGRIFEKLAWVDGKGDRETPTTYTYLDTKSEFTRDYVYYRLRQEDYNGNYTYSSIRKLKTSPTIIWQIMPNPVRDQLRIDWQGTLPTHTSLYVYNIQGQMVYTQPNWNPSFDAIHVAHLPTGVYLLQLVGQNYTATQRFVME